MIKRFLSERRRFGIFVPLIHITWLIYGMPGHIDDGQTWRRWLVEINPDEQLWSYFLYLFSGAVFLYAVVPQRFLNWFKTRHNQAESREPKKIYTERTAGEIFSAVGELTDMEMRRFAQLHLGKWIRVQSVVRDIT